MNPLSLRFLRPCLLFALCHGVLRADPAGEELPADHRFRVQTLLEGMRQPMELEFGPDGKIYFNEYEGRLARLDPVGGKVEELGKLEVFTAQENGFLGFALDPGFAHNRWIYCYYSPPGFEGQYLSRFVLGGAGLDLSSEKVLLKVEEQRKECCHHGGSVGFGPDGLLYLSTGDNTHPHGDSGGYAPLDEREGREPWNALRSAANTRELSGKILRIRPTKDGGYEIPEGNLFPPGTEGTRPEIYVMGCRNPWRISVDPKTGFLYWGEVGPDAGDDGPRGPRGYDELNQAKAAGNFGWPLFIGNNFAYHRFDYASQSAGAPFDPARPMNESRLNTGIAVLPKAEPALIYWPYRGPREFPELGEGGRTACAGPVYRWQPSFEESDGFPRYFDGSLLFWDWERPFLKWARLDDDSRLQRIESFSSAVVLANKPEQSQAAESEVSRGAVQLKRPVDAVFGPDGCLYLMDYGATWGANPDSRLVKISYVRGNLPPVAKASVTPEGGREPLTVAFSAEGSGDPDEGPLRYEWRTLPDGGLISEENKFSWEFTSPGSVEIELRVVDEGGAEARRRVTVNVGNSPPEVRFLTPQAGDFFTPGKPVLFEVEIEDQEDGNSRETAGVFGLQTRVSASVRGRDGKLKAADPGMALMLASDCFNCHAVQSRMIGPGLLEIADRYRGKPEAMDAAVGRVRSGSTGVWGPVPMLPHPQHTEDEVNLMLRWVFALEKSGADASMASGIKGEIPAPSGDDAVSFELEASYTDLGRAPALPATGRAHVSLRSRRLEAESGEVSGATIAGEKLGSINDGNWVKFAGIPRDQVAAVKVRTCSGNVGGVIEFRLGSPDGPLAGQIPVPNTGGWDQWIEPQSPLTFPESGGDRLVDVYAVFRNPGQGGLLDLDWVEFLPE